MMVRIVLVFAMLLSLSFNTFAQVAFKYKIENNNIVFTINGTDYPTEMGTKTAEYIMGYLSNSNQFSNFTKVKVNYNLQEYTIMQFYNRQTSGPAFKDYRLGFFRARNGNDVIKLFNGEVNELATFEIATDALPTNVMKVDYVVGQIIKWMNSYSIIGTNIHQEFCISNITVTNGIPTGITFEYNCP